MLHAILRISFRLLLLPIIYDFDYTQQNVLFRVNDLIACAVWASAGRARDGKVHAECPGGLLSNSIKCDRDRYQLLWLVNTQKTISWSTLNTHNRRYLGPP